MIKYYCSLCGTEIRGNLTDYHDLPKIEEERKTISGDTVRVLIWVSCKVLVGFICPDCKQMYIEKLLKALAETRTSIKSS